MYIHLSSLKGPSFTHLSVSYDEMWHRSFGSKVHKNHLSLKFCPQGFRGAAHLRPRGVAQRFQGRQFFYCFPQCFYLSLTTTIWRILSWKIWNLIIFISMYVPIAPIMAAYIACQRGNITAVVCISQLLDRLEAVECVQVFKYSSRTNTYFAS